MEIQAPAGLTSKSDSTDQLRQSFTSANQPLKHHHLPLIGAFWTRQHIGKLKLPLVRGLQFEKNARSRYFVLKIMVSSLNKLGGTGDNFKSRKLFRNSCADLIISSGAVCDGTQNVKQYRYQYFFQYQIFLIPIPGPIDWTHRLDPRDTDKKS